MPATDGNYPWTLTNRSKESLALNLKQAEGREVLDKLIARADVFIINYPLGVRERLGLTYEDVSAINPKAIYASLTPYGETGPEAGSTGYDATAWWARSGLMDLVRASSDTPPAVSMPGMGDQMAACSLYGAIVTALYRRQPTGVGAKVGTSLLANGLWSNVVMAQDWDHWNNAFSEYGITCGRIAKTADHYDDQQTQAGGALAEFDDDSGTRTVDGPLYVQGERKRAPQPAPAVEEQTLAILAELGIH